MPTCFLDRLLALFEPIQNLLDGSRYLVTNISCRLKLSNRIDRDQNLAGEVPFAEKLASDAGSSLLVTIITETILL